MTPLPTHKYIPGQTARHPEDRFDAMRSLALLPTKTATASQNPPWLYGIRLFEAGFYWEAHEVWEPVWLNARPNSTERFICQAVIQISNAALKRDMGKSRAAERLCTMAEGLLKQSTLAGRVPPMGLENAITKAAIAQIRQDVANGWKSALSLNDAL